MSTIDHKAEAEESLRGAGDGRSVATDASNNAIAHALLYLAEQARIANLIALASLPKQDGYENEYYDARMKAMFEGLFDFEQRPAVPGLGPAGIDEYMVMRPDIARALGLDKEDAS